MATPADRIAVLAKSAPDLTTEVTELSTRMKGVFSRLDNLEANAPPSATPATQVTPTVATSTASGGFSSAANQPLQDAFGMHGRVVLKRLIAKGKAAVGEELVVGGWMRTARMAQKKTLCFVELTDGSCQEHLQVVVEAAVLDITKFSTGASVMFRGKVVAAPEKATQDIEFEATELLWFGPCDKLEFPIPKSKDLTLEGLRSITHLRSRTAAMGAMFRIRNALASATHQFFQQNGFFYLHAPIITSHDCEGAGEMFQVSTLLLHADEKAKEAGPSESQLAASETAVKAAEEEIKAMREAKKDKRKIKAKDAELAKLKDANATLQAAARVVGGVPRTEDGKIDYGADFFAKKSYLTVSGQLDAEAYACSMTSVYTFGPTFRAEDSHTTRHLAEFWMIEPEIAFCDLEGDMKCAEQYVQFCLKFVLENCRSELEFFTAKEAAEVKKNPKDHDKEYSIRAGDASCLERVETVAKTPFVRLTYTEACELLIQHVKEGKKTFVEEVKWGIDLGSEHERYLAEVVFKGPVILYNYPADIKAFYMRLNDDKKTVAAMDVLVPGVGELIGGSQREERLDVLEQKMAAIGLEVSDYAFYTDLRKYGGVPHAGFGLGFERLVLFVTGLKNIRDVIPFPRYPGKIL